MEEVVQEGGQETEGFQHCQPLVQQRAWDPAPQSGGGLGQVPAELEVVAEEMREELELLELLELHPQRM